VAIKVLKTDVEGGEEIARRFRDEARILGMVRHRSVVQVDGLIMVGNRWGLVMEYIDGADLSEVLLHRGAVPIGPAIEIIGEDAAALDAAGVATQGEPVLARYNARMQPTVQHILAERTGAH
jgi:serine/threonine-protein kinase